MVRPDLIFGERIMKFLKKALTTTAVLAMITATGATAFATSNPEVGGAPMLADKNIVENAVKADNLKTLVAAVTAAGLADTLSSEGPFTVFAPTDKAFSKLPAGTIDTLLKPENKDQLASILTYHVVPAEAFAKDVVKMIKDGGGKAEVKTVAGTMLTLQLEGDKVAVIDENGGKAFVTIADVDQSNGVVHVIDSVLLPKS